MLFFLGGGGGEGGRGLIFFHYTEAKAKRLNGSFSKMRLCLIIDNQAKITSYSIEKNLEDTINPFCFTYFFLYH